MLDLFTVILLADHFCYVSLLVLPLHLYVSLQLRVLRHTRKEENYEQEHSDISLKSKHDLVAIPLILKVR